MRSFILDQIIFPQWEGIKLTEKYKVSFRKLGEKIILSIPEGNSEGGGMESFLEKREEFLRFTNLFDKGHIELKDYEFIKGRINRKDRILYTEHLISEGKRGCLKGLCGYNGSSMVKLSFEMGKLLYARNFPLLFCKNYDEALSKALEIIGDDQINRPGSIDDGSSDEIDKLFLYISSLNWNLENESNFIHSIDENSPYNKIYKSVALLKSDFENILEKQKETEKALQEAYIVIEKKVDERTIQLREERAKLETSLDILSHDTKNSFISLKYDMDQIEDGKLKNSMKESVGEIEELISEATGIMSSKKRITSIVELMENIRVTGKRTPLLSHDRIEVEFKSPEFLFVHTTALFKNAVSNLLENALKYTGIGNPVKVLVEKDHDVKIHIIDFGTGIPDPEKQKIMEKFYRREESSTIAGSGRGLWITNNIIKQENGSLHISDNPHGGTIFTISLPPYVVDDMDFMLKELSNWFEMPLDIIKSRAEAFRTLYTLQGRDDIEDLDSAVFTSLLTEIRRERKEEKRASINLKLERLKNRNPGGKTIIIADDSLYVQYYLARYFFELGMNIIDYADNGESALIAYKKRNPDYISLDNNMNVMTGPEAAEKIHEYNKDSKIIFITALGDSSVFREELKEVLPDDNYKILTKPIYKKDVEEVLKGF